MALMSLRVKEPWRIDAACNDPALGDEQQRLAIFFADDPARARLVCARCPVQRECALAGEGMTGVWAGMTARERDRAAYVETGWMAVCRRCTTPFPVEQRKGMSHAPFYCSACRVDVRAETVARYRLKARTVPDPSVLVTVVPRAEREGAPLSLVASAAR